MARIAFGLGVVVAIVACGPTAQHHTTGGHDAGVDGMGSNGSQPHTLTSIEVTPTNLVVELDLNSSGAQGYAATGKYADDVDEDLTTQVTWAAVNPAVGTITTGTLLIPSFTTATAVTSLITADFGGFQGQAQITVAAYRRSGPQGDFFFQLPYMDPGGPATKPLSFSTSIPALDVFFLMDTTGSMAGEIANLQSALTSTVIPGIQGAVADSEFGVGAQEDFPISPYGSSGCDQPLVLLQPITNSISAVQTGVAALSHNGSPIGCGNDEPEGGIEAIYQVATGEGLSSPAPTNVPANHTGVGGVGYRTGTMPVVVAISDADSHRVGETGNCNGVSDEYADPVLSVAHSSTQTKQALDNICARMVGIAAVASGSICTAQSYYEDLATSTGARVPPAAWDVGVRPSGCLAGQCCTGVGGVGRATDGDGLCPVVFIVNTDGTGVGANIATGIQMLTRFATFDTTSSRAGGTTDTNGNPLPGGYTTADFITAVTPTGFTLPPPPPDLPNPTFDATTFHTVTPGTTVRFQVDAFNSFVPQTDQAQIFAATITVLAGGCTPLDQRNVLILVPPIPIVIQ